MSYSIRAQVPEVDTYINIRLAAVLRTLRL